MKNEEIKDLDEFFEQNKVNLAEKIILQYKKLKDLVFDVSKIPVTRKLKKLQVKKQGISIPKYVFEPEERFNQGQGNAPTILMSEEFESKIYTNLMRSLATEGKKMDSFDVQENGMYDAQIFPELGNALLIPIRSLMPLIESMVSSQLKGEEGELLVNGIDNLFYTKLDNGKNEITVITVIYRSSLWCYFSHKIGERSSYPAGTRIFSSSEAE